MARLDMDKIVEKYNEFIDFDGKKKAIIVHVFNDKQDLIDKYVISNLFNMKIDEPNNGEKYDDKYKKYLEELKSLTAYIPEGDSIIIAMFGDYGAMDISNIQNIDTRVYLLKDIQLFLKDSKYFYTH